MDTTDKVLVVGGVIVIAGAAYVAYKTFTGAQADLADLTSGISSALKSATSALQTGVSDVTGDIASIGQNVTKIPGQAASDTAALVQIAQTTAGNLQTDLANGANTQAAQVEANAKSIASAVSTVGTNYITTPISQIITDSTSTIQKNVTNFQTLVGSATSAAASGVTGVSTDIQNDLSKIISSAGKAVKSISIG
jgi:hypothetical protein